MGESFCLCAVYLKRWILQSNGYGHVLFHIQTDVSKWNGVCVWACVSFVCVCWNNFTFGNKERELDALCAILIALSIWMVFFSFVFWRVWCLYAIDIIGIGLEIRINKFCLKFLWTHAFFLFSLCCHVRTLSFHLLYFQNYKLCLKHDFSSLLVDSLAYVRSFFHSPFLAHG